MFCKIVVSHVRMYFLRFRDDKVRYKSERLRDEAEKLIKSRENKTVHTQQASNQKLNNRLHDVVLFRSELEVILLSIYDFCFLFVTIKHF